MNAPLASGSIGVGVAKRFCVETPLGPSDASVNHPSIHAVVWDAG